MHDKASFCIEFDDAGVSRGGHIIWQHGTFRIPQGSVTAIVGTNGAGKTTMMKAELGLIPIAHGDITVLGKPAGAMNHRIGMCRRATHPTSNRTSPPNSRCCLA